MKVSLFPAQSRRQHLEDCSDVTGDTSCSTRNSSTCWRSAAFKASLRHTKHSISFSNPVLCLCPKVTILTGRPLTARGTSRICVSCWRRTGRAWNSPSYSRWSTRRCPWDELGTATTVVPSGRSRCRALPRCSPRSSISDQRNNRGASNRRLFTSNKNFLGKVSFTVSM